MGDPGEEKEEVVGRNLVLMFDGTWNVRGNWTNVARMFEAVDRVKVAEYFQPDGGLKPRDGERVQLVKYITGVGTGVWHKMISNLAGAMWGYGLSQLMLEGYLWLSENYRPHDNIFVFGFSRGAFTARALVALLHMCGGVLKLTPSTSEAEKKEVLDKAFELYSKRLESKRDVEALREFGRENCRRVRVKMVGVWDTVGALGVPDSLSNITETWWNAPFRSVAKAVMSPFKNRNYYRFHNQGLPCIVDEAYHALAIDEHRVDFLPSLWNKRKVLQPMADDEALGIALPPHGQTVEQCWFVGSHCNVGGGISNDDDPEDLWQLSYEWMQQKAENAGLRFKWRYISGTGQQRWKWLREVEDSFALMGNGVYAKTHTRIDRAIIREHLSMAGCKAESLHWSVKLRMQHDPSYRPPALESHPGEFENTPLKTILGEAFVPALVADSDGKKFHTDIPFEPLQEIEYCECRKVWKEKKKAQDGSKVSKDEISVYRHPLVLQNLRDISRRTDSDRYDRNGSTKSKSLKEM